MHRWALWVIYAGAVAMTDVDNVGMVDEVEPQSGAWNTRTSIGLFLGGLIVVAAAARLLTLTRPSLTNDEAYTVALSEHGFWSMLRLFRYEANGLLYPLIYWPIARLSDGPAALRMPALIAGVATVPVVYFIGRELAGRRVAVVGAVLIAVSPEAIAQSQNARAYSFALLLGSVSYLALLRARRGSRGAWVLYAVATALAGYAQILALFLIPISQVVAVMAAGRRFGLAWLRALGATAVLAAPAAALAVSEASRRNPLYWLNSPHLGAAVEFLMSFTVGNLEYRIASDGSTQLILLPIVVPLLWLLVIGAGFWWSRRLAAHRWATDPLATLLAWTAVPPLVLFALSQVKPMFLPDRYLITSLPGACLLVAMAAERLPGNVAPHRHNGRCCEFAGGRCVDDDSPQHHRLSRGGPVVGGESVTIDACGNRSVTASVAARLLRSGSSNGQR